MTELHRDNCIREYSLTILSGQYFAWEEGNHSDDSDEAKVPEGTIFNINNRRDLNTKHSKISAVKLDSILDIHPKPECIGAVTFILYIHKDIKKHWRFDPIHSGRLKAPSMYPRSFCIDSDPAELTNVTCDKEEVISFTCPHPSKWGERVFDLHLINIAPDGTATKVIIDPTIRNPF